MGALKYTRFQAMSTDILLGAEASEKVLGTAFGQARDLVAQEERRFTRFSEDSELSRLNRESGTWSEVSPEMFEVLDLALDLHEKTGGLFDPAILEALETAGYDRTIQELRAFGPAGGIQPAVLLRPRAFRGLALDPGGSQVRFPAGMRIDLGGIAKGWIAEQAAGRLALWSQNCVVDAGGDMLLMGKPEKGGWWQVALEDPRNADRDLALLNLPACALATSSVTKRRWFQNGSERHHLIDPRTGLPAENDWLSVTAIAGTLPEAEAWAKALLVAGPDETARLNPESYGIEYIAADRDGKLWGSRNSRRFIDD